MFAATKIQYDDVNVEAIASLYAYIVSQTTNSIHFNGVRGKMVFLGGHPAKC